MPLLLTVLIVITVLMIIGIIVFVMKSQKAEKQKKIQSLIQGRNTNNTKTLSLEDEQNKRRAEIARKLKEGESEESKKKSKGKKNTLRILLGQAGLELSPTKFMVFSGISGILFAVLGFVLASKPLLPILMFIIGFLGFPRFILKTITKKRQKNFLEEFPDALEAMVRLLKAGMPVSEAISMISREFTGPIGEEMTRIYNKQKIGIPLHEAAAEASKRMPLPEVKMFATGLAIQAQTGSSLSEVLMNLSAVIRARFKLKRKIKALSSEAIASASIIGSLPILLSLGMYFANREYIMILFETTTGNFLAGFAVFWMLTGCFVMKQMINFKI